MKCSNTEDAYNQLVNHNKDLKGFLAFAMLEEHKVLTLKRLEETNTKITQKYRLSEWYQQQPETLFDDIKDKANNMAIDYAEGIQEIFLYEIEKNIDNLEGKITNCESCVKKEIKNNHIACKKKHNFLPQFSINVLGGLTATLIAIIISFSVTVYIVYNRHKYEFTDMIIDEVRNELKSNNASPDTKETKKSDNSNLN